MKVTVSCPFSEAGGIAVSGEFDDDGIVQFDVTVPAGQADYAVGTYSLTDAKLQLLLLTVEDHDATVTIETNSSGAAQDTFTAAVDKPVAVLWMGNGANPIAGNVTTWFVSNPGTTDARVRMVARQTVP